MIGNMALVRAFSGFAREQRRFDATVEPEMVARRKACSISRSCGCFMPW